MKQGCGHDGGRSSTPAAAASVGNRSIAERIWWRVSPAGEPVLSGFATRRGRESLETILRFDEEEGQIARIRGYAFCPETMGAAGESLGLRVRTGPYRYPTPAPGKLWQKD